MGAEASSDEARIRGQLGAIEAAASTLTWAKKAPWKASSHVWLEAGVPTVDLHDLDVKLARRLVAELSVEGLEAGAITFVTGRGRHSPGGRSPLRDAVFGTLRKRARAEGWLVIPIGGGRLALVIDPERAPAHLRQRPAVALWLGILVFLALTAWVCLGMPGA